MTPTKTKTKNPAADVAKLEAAVTEAKAEVDDIRARVHLQRAHRQQLDQELRKLALTDPSAFGSNGEPRSETAKRLNNQLAEVSASRLEDVLAGAEGRARATQDEVTRYIAEQAEELSRAEFEGPGKAAVAKVKQGAALIAEGYSEYLGSAGRQMQLCAATQGLDGRDVGSDQRAAEIARQVAKLGDLAPPRSQSLCPLASEEAPPRYRVRSGGFVRSPHPDDIAVEQPQRVSL